MFENGWQNCPISMDTMHIPFISTVCGHTQDFNNLVRASGSCSLCFQGGNAPPELRHPVHLLLVDSVRPEANSVWTYNSGLDSAIRALYPVSEMDLPNIEKKAAMERWQNIIYPDFLESLRNTRPMRPFICRREDLCSRERTCAFCQEKMFTVSYGWCRNQKTYFLNFKLWDACQAQYQREVNAVRHQNIWTRLAKGSTLLAGTAVTVAASLAATRYFCAESAEQSQSTQVAVLPSTQFVCAAAGIVGQVGQQALDHLTANVLHPLAHTAMESFRNAKAYFFPPAPPEPLLVIDQIVAAYETNNHALIQQLAAQNKTVNLVTPAGLTPLYRAIYDGKPFVVGKLLEAGANVQHHFGRVNFYENATAHAQYSGYYEGNALAAALYTLNVGAVTLLLNANVELYSNIFHLYNKTIPNDAGYIAGALTLKPPKKSFYHILNCREYLSVKKRYFISIQDRDSIAKIEFLMEILHQADVSKESRWGTREPIVAFGSVRSGQ